MMKLYWSDLLSPRRACAVARYLESPVDFVYLDPSKGEHKTADYLAINPNGRVPTLVDDRFVLWEADAIMVHLAARSGSDLWPQDRRQTDVMRWLSWNLQHFYPHAATLYFQRIIKPRFGLGAVNADSVERALRQLRQFAPILDAHLAGREFVVGDALTIADFALASPLYAADAIGMPLAEYREIARWNAGLNTIEAWREPFPETAAVA